MSLLFRWLAATTTAGFAALLPAGIARIELPWTSFGVTDVAFIEILGERGEERIGQNDRFVMVEFAQVRIGQMDYFLGSPALGKREANLGEPRTRVRSGRGRGGVNGYSDSAESCP